MTDWLLDLVRLNAADIGERYPHLRAPMEEIGGRRMPEVRRLLPDRDSTAVDCDMCQLTGLVQDVVCPTCGGLGWVPPEAPETVS